MNTPEGTLWGSLYYDKVDLPMGPDYSIRDGYVMAMLWEMGFRKMKEKLHFAFMIREGNRNINKEGKSMETALDGYINVVAPFIAEDKDRERKKYMEILEKESQQMFKVAPVRLPSKRLVPFTKGKTKK
jgi:hypothetical protein